MLESKSNWSLLSRNEIANFCDCGDARGQLWLDRHPEARARAEDILHRLHDHHDSPLAHADPGLTAEL